MNDYQKVCIGLGVALLVAGMALGAFIAWLV